MNGSYSNLPRTDHAQPSERTPLISHPNATDIDSRPLHLIDPVVAQVRSQGIDVTTSSWSPETIPNAAERTAFSLIVLLWAKITLGERNEAEDIWEEWSTEREEFRLTESLECEILGVWNDFIQDGRTEKEIEDVLWSSFIFNEKDSIGIRVVDLLSHPQTPEGLLTHQVVQLSLLKMWGHGYTHSQRDMTTIGRVARWLDSRSTPRVMHLLNLSIQLIYLVCLLHYAILPPTSYADTDRLEVPGLREDFLILYSLAEVCRPWTLLVTPYIFTLLAFMVSLPSLPYPSDYAYSALLVALSAHILLLHTSRPPTPILLLPFEKTLPLATLIWHGISRIFIPVLLFFLPALLLALFLLSLSLSDILPQQLTITTFEPAPLEARTAFLFLFAVLFILLLSSLVILTLVYPTFIPDSTSLSQWDQYSKPIGLDARRAFAGIVVSYTQPYIFPPPLNLPDLVLRLPKSVLLRLGMKRTASWLYSAEKALWRVIVGPFVLIISGCYWLVGLVL